MRFLVDVGLAPATSRYLTAAGHDSVHLYDRRMERLTDRAIIRVAESENRVILTHDLDFSRMVALGRGRFPSIITFRLQDMRPENVNRHIDIVIHQLEAEVLTGALVSVSEESIRVRSLPVK
jgi:predicted nuclease of predicted toxin-antitoxin system